MVRERHVALHQSLDRLRDLLVSKDTDLRNLAREGAEIDGECFRVRSKVTAPRCIKLAPRALAAGTNQGRALHKPDVPSEHRGSGASLRGGPLPFGLLDVP